MNPQDTISILGQQIPVALVLVYLQNWIKKQSYFPWLTYESKNLNHFVSIALAGVATLGIAVSHTGSIAAGGTLIITFPSGAVFLTSVYHWVTQYIMSKTAYTALQSQLNPATQQQPMPVVLMPGSKTLAPEIDTKK